MGVGQEQCCAICCSEYVKDEVITELPCHHLFHRPCVTLWLQEVSATGLAGVLWGFLSICILLGRTVCSFLKTWDEVPINNWLLILCIMEPNFSASGESNLYLYSSKGQFFE